MRGQLLLAAGEASLAQKEDSPLATFSISQVPTYSVKRGVDFLGWQQYRLSLAQRECSPLATFWISLENTSSPVLEENRQELWGLAALEASLAERDDFPRTLRKEAGTLVSGGRRGSPAREGMFHPCYFFDFA
jgi:hypothetical protein